MRLEANKLLGLMSLPVLPGPPAPFAVAHPRKMGLCRSLLFVLPPSNSLHNCLKALDRNLALYYKTSKRLPITTTKTLILVLPIPNPLLPSRLRSYQAETNLHAIHPTAVATIHPQGSILPFHMSPSQKKGAVPAMIAIYRPSLSVVLTQTSDHGLDRVG